MYVTNLSCSCGSGLNSYPERDGSPTLEQFVWLSSHIQDGHKVLGAPWAALVYRLLVGEI